VAGNGRESELILNSLSASLEVGIGWSKRQRVGLAVYLMMYGFVRKTGGTMRWSVLLSMECTTKLHLFLIH